MVLALAHAFFDERLTHGGDEVLFRRLEAIGTEILKRFDKRMCFSGPICALQACRCANARVIVNVSACRG